MVIISFPFSENCPESPWAFVGAISSTLASNILPVSSFLQLKIGLMLSLATQNTEDAPVPLVAVGSDTFAVQKLITSAGLLAERFIRYSAGYEQLEMIIQTYSGGDKRRPAREEIYYDAGAMVLALSGVCYLGDWSILRKDQCKYIFRSIESGQIILNNTDKNKAEADFLPLKCAVWTHCSHAACRNQNNQQLKTLIDVFGMPFLADENDETEVMKVSQKILQFSIHGTDNEQSDMKIPVDDFKEFISLINSRNLVLNESASKLIHDFFVVIRRERPECLPMRAIKIITSLAEAHARLALRNEITYEDVIAILYLYNESVSALFGSPFIKSKNYNLDNSELLYRRVRRFHPVLLNIKMS
ncbi:UNVERIFIED_CONTAM: hypothetical protein PYX00_009492 [Menopon gallinae]|uniref:MCM AAA-lid domain-containing protein n=1 Tax=Menopon gallinae TaxID=328185 RepID=A0AAW2HBU1_9NEOP